MVCGECGQSDAAGECTCDEPWERPPPADRPPADRQAVAEARVQVAALVEVPTALPPHLLLHAAQESVDAAGVLAVAATNASFAAACTDAPNTMSRLQDARRAAMNALGKINEEANFALARASSILDAAIDDIDAAMAECRRTAMTPREASTRPTEKAEAAMESDIANARQMQRGSKPAAAPAEAPPK